MRLWIFSLISSRITGEMALSRPPDDVQSWAKKQMEKDPRFPDNIDTDPDGNIDFSEWGKDALIASAKSIFGVEALYSAAEVLLRKILRGTEGTPEDRFNQLKTAVIDGSEHDNEDPYTGGKE
jgi:hypothetical protein